MKQLRHFVAAALVVLGSSYALAQTESNPFVLQNGSNTVTCSSYYTYVKYTATEDALVMMEGARVSDGYVTCGTELVSACPNYGASAAATYFAVESGKSYVARIYTGDANSVDLTVKSNPAAYNNGQSCSDPIVATEGAETYVPMVKNGTSYSASAVPVYVEFTPSITGKVVVTILQTGMTGNNSALANMFYDTECDGDFNTFTNNAQMSTGSFRCEAGQKYLIRMNGSQGAFVTYQSMEIVEGASCDDAFMAKAGENVIPAAAGTYWYSFTTPAGSNSYLEISSAASVSGVLQNTCTPGYYDTTTKLDVLNYRGEVYANSTRILKLVKETATTDAESFTLAFASAQPYDKKSTAEAIEADKEYTTPAFNGTYFYKITTPAEGAYFLNAQTLNATGSVNVAIYDGDGEYSSSIAYGTNKARYAVAADKNYWIAIDVPVGMKSVPFKVTYEEVEPGMTKTSPIAAVVGDNDLKAWDNVYYSFDCPETKWVIITVPQEVYGPDVLDKEGSNITVNSLGDNKYSFEGVADAKYMLCFRNIKEAAKFSIAQEAYEPGSVRAMPIEVTAETTSLPEAAGKYWYVYTATVDGFLTLTTDIKYDYSAGSPVMYINNSTSQSGYCQYDYSTYLYKPYKITVNKGDKVYIKIGKIEEADKTFSLSEAEAQPGSIPSKPLVFDLADSNEVVVPDADYNNPVYVAVKANADGNMKMLAQSNSYLGLILYSDPGFNNYVAASNTDYGTQPYVSGFQKISVEEGEFYYFKNTGTGATYTCSITPAGPGETVKTAIPIENNGREESVAFTAEGYNGTWYSIELGAGELKVQKAENKYAWWGVYAASDTRTAILYDEMGNDPDYQTYTIPEAGKYYLNFKYITTGETLDMLLIGSAVQYAPAEYAGYMLLNTDNGKVGTWTATTDGFESKVTEKGADFTLAVEKENSTADLYNPGENTQALVIPKGAALSLSVEDIYLTSVVLTVDNSFYGLEDNDGFVRNLTLPEGWTCEIYDNLYILRNEGAQSLKAVSAEGELRIHKIVVDGIENLPVPVPPTYVTLTVNVENGYASTVNVIEGSTATLGFDLDEYWTLENVSFNGEDYTTKLVENALTTPELTENSTVTAAIEYAGDLQVVNENDVKEIENNRIKISVIEGQIIIAGLVSGDDVCLYNAAGQVIAHPAVADEIMKLTVEGNGVYVVRVNKSAVKAIVK